MKLDKEKVDMGDKLTARDWGFASVSAEEIAASLEWHRTQRVESLGRVINSCIMLEQIIPAFSVRPEDAARLMAEKQLIGVDLGDAGIFFPRWQFQVTSSGETVVDQDLLALWREHDGTGLHFCEDMLGANEGEKTLLERYRAGDESVMFIMKEIRNTPGMW
jgi:hypothetical protein